MSEILNNNDPVEQDGEAIVDIINEDAGEDSDVAESAKKILGKMAMAGTLNHEMLNEVTGALQLDEEAIDEVRKTVEQQLPGDSPEEVRRRPDEEPEQSGFEPPMGGEHMA